MTHTEAADLRLSTRIEQASSGSRELDAGIHEAVTSFPARRAGPGWADENALVVPVFLGWDILPAYTTSLDAALTLVPQEWAWAVQHSDATQGEAWIYPPDNLADEQFCGKAATPALALAAAAMLALGL